MENINVEHFFKSEYVGFSAYDNIRKIAHAVDGLKNSSRKIVYYTTKENVKDFVKVSNLGPRIQDATEYLHGSLEGVVANITASYVGSNNIPYLLGSGNFGKRFVPEASASRYISSKLNPVVRKLYPKDDDKILESQTFEGVQIEPKFFVPILPMLLINGSEGVSVGFSQKILPRNPEDIINAINGEQNDLIPWYRGFNGTIVAGENHGQWHICGKIERVNLTKLIITEVPIGYNLKSYSAVLEKLVEQKVIKNYEDLCDDDIFKFEITTTREFGALDDEEVLKKLKLIKVVTENYTAIGVDNRVVEFKSAHDILDYWKSVRLEFNYNRKQYLLGKMQDDMDLAMAKIKFIKLIIEDKLIINKKSKEQIVKQINELDQSLSTYIDQLLGLPILSLTPERMKKLVDDVKEIKSDLKFIQSQNEEDVLHSDLESLNLSELK